MLNKSEVYKSKCKRTNEFVALKKVLTENEKEGVGVLNFYLFELKINLIAINKINQKISSQSQHCAKLRSYKS